MQPASDASVDGRRRPAAVISLGIAAAVAYGIVHDLVTAHLCVEYFTVAHPRIIASEDPVVLALFWGVFATWWVGLVLGFLLAFATQAGRSPPVAFLRVARQIAMLLAVAAASAAGAGAIAWWLAACAWIVPPGEFATRIAAARHARFLAVAAAHSVSYGVAFLGGAVLVVGNWRRRRREPPR